MSNVTAEDEEFCLFSSMFEVTSHIIVISVLSLPTAIKQACFSSPPSFSSKIVYVTMSCILSLAYSASQCKNKCHAEINQLWQNLRGLKLGPIRFRLEYWMQWYRFWGDTPDIDGTDDFVVVGRSNIWQTSKNPKIHAYGSFSQIDVQL